MNLTRKEDSSRLVLCPGRARLLQCNLCPLCLEGTAPRQISLTFHGIRPRICVGYYDYYSYLWYIEGADVNRRYVLDRTEPCIWRTSVDVPSEWYKKHYGECGDCSSGHFYGPWYKGTANKTLTLILRRYGDAAEMVLCMGDGFFLGCTFKGRLLIEGDIDCMWNRGMANTSCWFYSGGECLGPVGGGVLIEPIR